MIEGCTQQVGEYSQATMSATMNSSRPAQPSPYDVDVWGILRRKGGDQEEYKLRHRLKDGRRDTYLLGRSQTCDVSVNISKAISTAHCLIYCDYSQARLRVFIEDT